MSMQEGEKALVPELEEPERGDEAIANEDAAEEVAHAPLVERLRQMGDQVIDTANQHKVLAAATVVGIAAVAAAAIVAGRKGYFRTPEGHKVFVGLGDQRRQGVASVVEFTEPAGAPTDIVASFPVSIPALKAMQSDTKRVKALFVMNGNRQFAFPLHGDERHLLTYHETTQRVRGWLLHLLDSGQEADE